MKLIFAGTPEFAAMALDALVAAGHEIKLVLTQPDRPAGRGMQVVASAVKQRALNYGLDLLQPTTLKDPTIQNKLVECGAEAMIVAAYGLILPPAVLAIPKLGCINIHASLLPRWRGAAPIQRAILAGDKHTGISIMQMEAGLDTGPVYLQQSIAIGNEDTAQTLHDKLADLGAKLVVTALKGLSQNTLKAQAQVDSEATYAPKISRDEAKINWANTSAYIERAIRAYNPFPGSFAFFKTQLVKIWAAELGDTRRGDPGEILDINSRGILVACKNSSIWLTQLQRSGGKSMDATAFVRGFELETGQFFS